MDAPPRLYLQVNELAEDKSGFCWRPPRKRGLGERSNSALASVFRELARSVVAPPRSCPEIRFRLTAAERLPFSNRQWLPALSVIVRIRSLVRFARVEAAQSRKRFFN